jgi:hypothetical protein
VREEPVPRVVVLVLGTGPGQGLLHPGEGRVILA